MILERGKKHIGSQFLVFHVQMDVGCETSTKNSDKSSSQPTNIENDFYSISDLCKISSSQLEAIDELNDSLLNENHIDVSYNSSNSISNKLNNENCSLMSRTCHYRACNGRQF